MHTVHISVVLMGCRFGTGEGGKNHSMLTTKNWTTPLVLQYFVASRRQGKSHADAMVVICLFSMLIYSPIKSPQSLIFFFQTEILKSCLFVFSSYRNIYCRKTKYRNVSFFQYRAALHYTIVYRHPKLSCDDA